jgi:serine/threonine-protein kinase RsbW/stage II sporulation protein AB (anti-sigma F factor)
VTDAARDGPEGLGRVSALTGAIPATRWAGEAVPAQIGSLRAAVAAFASGAGAPAALVDDIRLAVSEALSNTVVHAYRNTGGRVEVRASVDAAAGVIAIGVRDYGIGCNPRTDSPGIGMGVPLMTALARTVNVAAPTDGGTDVCLTFALPAT